MIIFQGSRLGYGKYLDTKYVPSYRAISLINGKELWRLNVKMTDSYSRDVDGSCLIIKDTLYIGLENGNFNVIDPDPSNTVLIDNMNQPPILQEFQLYNKTDIIAHKKNLVTESSPCKIGNHIYIASGSGHVYGYNMDKDSLDWEFFIGSDIDGSAVVTDDNCLLVSIEKQYINGNGGLFKLNPKKKGNSCVEWFFPVEGTKMESWEGGIIGTAAIKNSYKKPNEPNLTAIIGINGYLYVIDHKKLENNKLNLGPNKMHKYPAPKVTYSEFIGPSISTPLIVNDKLIVAGYNGIRLYKFKDNQTLRLLDEFQSEFEATPFVHDNKIYIASRNGFLYCFGN